MKIILTGSSGLVGSRFVQLLSERHEIVPLLSKEVFFLDSNAVEDFFQKNSADVIVHLAAKTDVDGCEKDKEADIKQINTFVKGLDSVAGFDWDSSQWDDSSSAFAVNFLVTRSLYNAASKHNLKFVYISTDFVFEGNGEYNEDSVPNPLNWYGQTKYFGEQIIDPRQNLIVRTSFPYGYPSDVKQDFIQKLIYFLREKEEVTLIGDQTITPTFIDDLVLGIEFLIGKNEKGIVHVTGSSSITPYKIGEIINNEFGFGAALRSIGGKEFYEGRAPRPFKSIVKNDKLIQLGFKPKTFEEGLNLIKNP